MSAAARVELEEGVCPQCGHITPAADRFKGGQVVTWHAPGLPTLRHRRRVNPRRVQVARKQP